MASHAACPMPCGTGSQGSQRRGRHTIHSSCKRDMYSCKQTQSRVSGRWPSCTSAQRDPLMRSRQRDVVRCCSGGDPTTTTAAAVTTDTTTVSAAANVAVDGPPDGVPRNNGLLVEVSTGGQQQRRWVRSAAGGFDRLPPTRQSQADVAAGAAAKQEDEGWSWDLRKSPRLRAIFLPAGQGRARAAQPRAAFQYFHRHPLDFLSKLVRGAPSPLPPATLQPLDTPHVTTLRLVKPRSSSEETIEPIDTSLTSTSRHTAPLNFRCSSEESR